MTKIGLAADFLSARFLCRLSGKFLFLRMKKPLMEFTERLPIGYFATKRFDRKKDANGNTQRIHMISVGALLETSHRYPNLDYNDLMRLTLHITRDFVEVEKIYR